MGGADRGETLDLHSPLDILDIPETGAGAGAETEALSEMFHLQDDLDRLLVEGRAGIQRLADNSGQSGGELAVN